MSLNAQAVELNEAIKAANPSVFSMLSEKGRGIFFPKKGILAQTAEAAGKEINATIGTALEDNNAPMCLESLARQINMHGKQIFSYAPSPGRPEIRSIWKEMLFKKNPSLAGAAISLPVVTSALTHGLSMAGYMFADPGNRIILPDLYWENYDLVFANAYDALMDTYPMFVGDAFNVEGLKQRLSQGGIGKKIVLLNFPNNPTGYTVTKAEAHAIAQALIASAQAGNDIVVFIDDAYFGLVFEENIIAESLFGLLANAHERLLAVKFDGPTKEDYVWGFRVGFVTFGCGRNTARLYTALEAKLSGAIRGCISNASNIGQTLLVTAYGDKNYNAEKLEKSAMLKKRFEKIRGILASHTEYREVFEPLPFNSGYFMCVRVKSGEAEAVRKVLLEKYSTGIIAMGDLIRIAFSSTPYSKLELLMSNIYWAAKDAAGAKA
ncbi:MAG TPA: aminotransferase class I/II-fold pyridoxal phosphate-dependent enzyme [Chitinivibrionales bacterium]